MSAATVLARGRTAAEALMVDACVIRRESGRVTDTFSGVITTTYTTVYSGPCKLQQHAAQGRSEDAGEDYLVMLMRELHLPVTGTEDLRRNDEVTITACEHDADLVGRVSLIKDLMSKSFATARRLSIQERT